MLIYFFLTDCADNQRNYYSTQIGVHRGEAELSTGEPVKPSTQHVVMIKEPRHLPLHIVKSRVLAIDDTQMPPAILRNDFGQPNEWDERAFWVFFKREGHKMPNPFIDLNGNIVVGADVVMEGPR